MALPILDGNQSAATLSTIITGGAHIPAHTVVSLGSQAISDITSGVSGSVVSVSNFPTSQATTFGAVTGSVSVLNFPASQSVTFTQASVTFGVTTGSVSVLNFPASQTVTFTQTSTTFSAITGSISVLNFPASQAIAGTVTANVPLSDISGGIADYISGTDSFVVSPLGGVTFPISGTVTAMLDNDNFSGALTSYIEAVSSHNAFPVEIAYQPSVTIGSLPAISGTVTANTGINIGGNLPSGINAGIVPVVILDDEGHSVGDSGRSLKTSVVSTVTVGALPSGSLTTRFGSVATANLAAITSAVTNTSRKYLLAQNISAGTVTIGIGFSPTTTQGIQLPAGGGLTFDAFCPTGAVYWLGAVTGAAYTILEG